jgi:hypothetical protein
VQKATKLTALPGVEDEARRLLQASAERKVVLRLLGGVGIALRCPSAREGGLRRNYVDMDFVGHEKQSKAIMEFFTAMEYQPRVRFNALMGRKRLIFNDLVNKRRVDIFLDVFEMSHKFDFSKRLALEAVTLPLADLLATKLQIYEINEKDFKDLTSLILDHDIGPGDGETINGHYLAKICAGDWGAYKTFTRNLTTLETMMEGFGLSATQLDTARQRIRKLVDLIEGEPKTLGWRMRARVGEKVPWYELPESDKSIVVDSFD